MSNGVAVELLEARIRELEAFRNELQAENSRLASERQALAKQYVDATAYGDYRDKVCQERERVLQNIMQVLGPDVPRDVDYTVPQNAAGLIAEVEMALTYLKDAGIEYVRRKK